MLYALLIYADPEPVLRGRDDDDEMSQHFKLAADLRERNAYVASEALGPALRTVRVRDGRPLLTDGPHAETKEMVGGFYIVDCQDLAEAEAIAARIPPSARGAVEVRAVMHVDGWDYGATAARQRHTFS
ncbi:MAG TPA: YciI family protein [Dehalococcoidia bacterium]|nr:YciI family protein [Dehalococcoidia bacterium]